MSGKGEQDNSQQNDGEHTCVVCFKRTYIFSIGLVLQKFVIRHRFLLIIANFF